MKMNEYAEVPKTCILSFGQQEATNLVVKRFRMNVYPYGKGPYFILTKKTPKNLQK